MPTPAERNGDFSGIGAPLLNLAAGGTPFPGNQLPAPAINPVALNVVNLYPLGNVSPSIYRETLIGKNELDQFGARTDFNASSNDQMFARYSYSGGHNLNPVSVRGTDVPGYPTRDDLAAHSAVLSNTHIFTPSLTHCGPRQRAALQVLLRSALEQDAAERARLRLRLVERAGRRGRRSSTSPATRRSAARSPDRATRRRQTFEIQDSVTWTRGAHLMKFGGEFRHNAIDMVQAIAPNAFFVFASTFPTNNAIANLLLGAPVTFYQGLGDFTRGMRVWGLGAYAQDEWRVSRGVTLNYGLRSNASIR